MISWSHNDAVVVTVDLDADVHRICLERWVTSIISRWTEEGEECNHGSFVRTKGKSASRLIWIFAVSHAKTGFGFFAGYGSLDIVPLVAYVYLVVGIIEWWVLHFEKGGTLLRLRKNTVIIELGGLPSINSIREQSFTQNFYSIEYIM